MVSAWENQNNLVLGQVKVFEKSNLITAIPQLLEINKWKNLATVIKIESIPEFKNSEKTTQQAIRYYISSIRASPKDFQRAIRSHWAIENKLHWILDVAFSEDASRQRTANATQNFSILSKTALNFLKNEKSSKAGIKSRRLKAGWDNHYLIKILNPMKV